jgi:hypothetical protein
MYRGILNLCQAVSRLELIIRQARCRILATGIKKMCVIQMYDWNRKGWIIRHTKRHKTEIQA